MSDMIVHLRDELVGELNATVDRVLQRVLGTGVLEGSIVTAQTGRSEPEVQITPGEEVPYEYRWPDGTNVTYDSARCYTLSVGHGSRQVIVGWTRSKVWGRDRRRAVVFGQDGGANSQQLYPWAEFVETDDGRYAAQIRDPERPRSMLKDGQPLPIRFELAEVRRADELFWTIVDGPSLRLVLQGTDEVAMVAHGFWVATLRGRS